MSEPKPVITPPPLMPLDVRNDNMVKEWDYWHRSYERYCRIAKVTKNEDKCDVFFAFIGRETEEFLRDLPDFDKLTKIEQLLEKVKSRYMKTPNVLCERYNFRKIKILPEESIVDFNARLNSCSKYCDFNNYSRDLAHLDQIILNAHPKLREKLLLEKDLNLNKAIDIANYAAEGSNWANQFNDIVPNREVNFNKRSVKTSSHYSMPNKTKVKTNLKNKCLRCGSDKHLANNENCPAFKITCNKCNKLGHFAKHCLTKSKGKIKSEVKTVISDNCDLNVLTVGNNVTCPSNSHKFIELYVNNILVKFIIDSGSQATLVPESIFSKFKCKLNSPTVNLVDYNGNSIKCLGECAVNVVHGKDEFKGTIYVTKNKASLLGADWIQKLQNVNWNSLLVGNLNKSVCNVDLILAQFSNVFDNVPEDKVKNKRATLVLKANAVPKFCRPRRVPYAIKSVVEAEIDRLVKFGFWTPTTESEWATPLVPVVKADNSVRLCGDYKVTLNPQLEVAQHPLPTNEELFSKLGNCVVFSKLDLCHAFQQLELDDKSKDICTVNTSKGLFRVNRLPFGVASSPAIWQRTVDGLFAGLDGVLCFVDDILISAPNIETHNSRLITVLGILNEHNMHIKKEKCLFAVSSVSYLGFEIDAEGIHKTDGKIKAIKNVKVPSTVSELRSFIGLVNFYGKFVPDLSTIAAPLYDLLKKDVDFNWDDGCQHAFKQLKEELTSKRFLTHYQPDLPVRLACDASAYGLGAVLSHVLPGGEERPIAYASRTLQKAELNYSQIDKEALSIIYGVKHFHYYLYGRHFELLTDHKPLLAIFGEKSELPAMIAARLQRYAVTLSGYDYEIKFRPSVKHGNADALSRLPVKVTENSHSHEGEGVQQTLLVHFATPVSANDIKCATKTDKTLVKIYDCILTGKDLPRDIDFAAYRAVKDSLNIENGIILKDSRVVIPKSLRASILSVLHEEHMGICKTKSLARSYVWWPNIDKDIEALINSCFACQSNRNEPAKVVNHSWEYPKGPWQRLHIDFAGPINGINYFIVVDAFSKWPEVITMNNTTSGNCIKALRSLFARHGLPFVLVSDNGPQFVSEEFESFLSNNCIKHVKTAPYYPATNGEAERYVQTFKNYLKIAEPNMRDLEASIQSFLLTYRTTPHSVTGYSPSELLFKRQIRNVLGLVRPYVSNDKLATSSVKSSRELVSSFEPGQSVLIRNYRGERKWIAGTISEVLGKLHYLIDVNGRKMKRHLNQIKSFNNYKTTKNYQTYDLCELINVGDSKRHQSQHGGVISVENGRNCENNKNCENRYPVRNNRGIPPDRINL